MRNENQIKGKILEEVLKFHLEKQGYMVVPKTIRNYYGVKIDRGDLWVKGRGAWHQIDVLGQFKFQIPFVYPLRLICEAKCWKRKIGLDVVRNFVSVVKDISENYFIEKPEELKFKQRSRFTDCGVIFSTSEFTKNAQMFAYAHGIYLVNVRELLPLIEEIFEKIKYGNFEKLKRFLLFVEALNKDPEGREFREYLIKKVKEKYCYFGLAGGIYPVCIVSDEKFPEEEFRNKDEGTVRIFYRYREVEGEREILYFILKFGRWEGKFQLPRYIWEKYIESPDFRNAMLSMKEKHLNYIDIPLIIDSMRRIIRLNLDKSWIESMRGGNENG